MADGEDQRPQYQSGVGIINGTQFHWGSGTPGKYWSIPYGDYPITTDAPTGAWAHQVGAIPINNNIIPDPVLHRNRVGIMIHPSSSSNLDTLYTQGCFAVAPQDWPAVRQQILDESAKGPLYLHVEPGQAAAFTHTKTLDQAGAPPASESGAAAGTGSGTTATQPAASAWRNPTGVDLPMGMGNNNPANIKFYAGPSFAGVVGPSKNTDQGDPQFVFETPQAGMNAAYQLLGRKYANGMTTPAQIIAGNGGWTPGNMQAAANVAKSAGIGVNDDIGFNDPAKAQKFLSALVKQEQGGASSYYPNDLYANAIAGKVTPAAATPTAAPPGTTVNTTGLLAGATPSGSMLPGFSSSQASDKFLKSTKDLADAASGQDQGGQQQPKPLQLPPAPQAYRPSPQMAMQMMQNISGYNPYSLGTSLTSMGLPRWAAGPVGANPGANVGQQSQPNQINPYGTSLASLRMMQMQNDPYDYYGNMMGSGYG